ncbi:MAG: phosphoglycerate dehydrogenase [Nitrospirae bacterium]|nr:phosphoglycerate dehydrogenase [Nitrospirota bacterium]
MVSAPPLIQSLDAFREVFVRHGIEIVVAQAQQRLGEAELIPLVRDIDGTICSDDEYNDRVLEAAPRLKVISRWGTGMDSIDLTSAERRGIRVTNVPGAFTEPVADTVLAFMLAFSRRIVESDRIVRSGSWEKTASRSLGECALGVIGVGEIGKAVIRRASAFGMRVLGHDPVSPPADFLQAHRVSMVPLQDLLRTADFASLNCSLNPTSHHLIGDAELRLMKPSAYLINTSRGPVVDENALARALAEGRIAGAALDVFENEPLPAHSPLRKYDHCFLAPHNANASPAAWRMTHERAILNLLSALEGDA